MLWFILGLLFTGSSVASAARLDLALQEFNSRPAMQTGKLARPDERQIRGVVESYYPWMLPEDKEWANEIQRGSFPPGASFEIGEEAGVAVVYLVLRLSRISVVHGTSKVRSYQPEAYCRSLRCEEALAPVPVEDLRAPKIRVEARQLRIPAEHQHWANETKKSQLTVFEGMVSGEPENLKRATAYFASTRPIKNTAKKKWIPIVEFLPPNPARLLNRFAPVELTGKFKTEIRSPNCYSTVRNFFFDDMEPYSPEANSITTFHAFLGRSYCPVLPRRFRYGDIITYKDHAVRFLAYDERSEGWVFEKSSGSVVAPWKLAPLSELFPTRSEIAVYRRCVKS